RTRLQWVRLPQPDRHRDHKLANCSMHASTPAEPAFAAEGGCVPGKMVVLVGKSTFLRTVLLKLRTASNGSIIQIITNKSTARYPPS
ncbi:MAG: hypothetical protein ABL952_13965, partial [Pyrinomonadaceae bacterium]